MCAGLANKTIELGKGHSVSYRRETHFLVRELSEKEKKARWKSVLGWGAIIVMVIVSYLTLCLRGERLTQMEGMTLAR